MKKIIIFLIIIGIGTALFLNFDKIKDTVTPNPYIELGYNENDVVIIEKLNNPKIILDYEYNKDIINFIKNENFKEENLKNYIEINEKYEFSIDDIIYIGNNYDSNIEYNEIILELMKEKYYVPSNLERYLKYKENNDKENSDIILEVNSNLDKTFYQDIEPTDLSKGYLILVNKYNYLESNYVPDNLVQIESLYGVSQYLESKTYEQYKKMWEDASNEGLTLYINSPYRSYSVQNVLYNNYVARDGKSLADTYSARPGFSEHQTGLAFDVTSKTTNFSNFEYSTEYEWLQDNAYKYGFILRYPQGKEYITGYQYESWHYRYVGKDVAKYIHDNDITYEEYYAYFVK